MRPPPPTSVWVHRIHPGIALSVLMYPPLYTLFRISPLFSRDILEMAQ